jgi:serine protease Do
MEFDGKPVDSTKTLGRFVAEQDSGSRVSLTVWRDGQSEEIDVELGELDNPAKTARLSPAASDVGTDLGLVLQDLTQSARDQLGLDADTEGAVVARVAPGSTAAREGIEPGDVILQVNQQRIDSAADVLDELAAARAEGRRALLLVRRGDAQRFVALDFA